MDHLLQARSQLIFQSGIARQKPHTLHSDDDPAACPFCDHSQLPPIMKRDGDIILVPNKYPILKDTDPFVLIETADCHSELSQYSHDHLIRVLRMAFDFWHEMLNDDRYTSVMFLKNHGPLSGGSLRHPHMQLIGLYDIDCNADIHRDIFYGPIIRKNDGVELNVSSHPRVGFTEFNVIMTEWEAFDTFCDFIQKTVQFILLHHFDRQFSSYNLFFYQFEGVAYCKAMPRYATTPIYIGYSIAQVIDHLDSIVDEFIHTCFPF
jgi:ATP adenylyltransferase/5',5'''-P-1,P-4-tetraphosphate phosphorylase II